MTDEAQPAPTPKPARRKRGWGQRIALGVAIFALVFAGFGLVARFGVMLPQARLLIEARTSGLKVGRFGRLKIEGLSGDIWRNFGIRRLTIADQKGVWLDARGISMRWSYLQLLSRRLQIDEVTAQQVLVARRPTLSAKGGVSSGMPLTIVIDQARARIDLAPAFSVVRGAYDARLTKLELRRAGGGQTGAVALRSLTRPGDFLDASFLMGGLDKRLQLDVKAAEASGGALAGAIGLDPKKAFDLKAKASGTNSQGRFDLKLVSGAAVPAEATGAWTPDGGSGQGRLTLGASTLTADWAERAGPEASFRVSGRRLREGLYALDAQAKAENLAIAVRGDGNLGERRTGPNGVDLSLSTPQIKRFVSWIEGGVALRGRFKGEASDWRFEGRGDLSRLGTAGYVLQRVTGPVQIGFRNSQLTVTGDVAGTGGGGEGILLAALGATPKAKFDVVRLKDGRLLFRRIDARGDGLVLEGKGGQGLFNDLSFEGRATLSNLERARAGARGELSGTWHARQGGGDKPWLFDIDTRAKGFASGYAELDRLLGSDPRVTMDASYGQDVFQVASAKVTGAAASLSAAGLREADGALKFKLDWQATGPFRVGPVEVAGKAAGTGALTGKFEAPRLDLLADIDRLDVPRLPLTNAKLTLTFQSQPNGSNGAVTLVGASEYGEARARSDFAFAGDGVDLTALDVDAGGVKAKGRLTLRSGSPSSADLTLAVGPGAVLDRGEMAGTLRIVDAAPAARAAVDLTAKNAVLRKSPVAIRNGRFTGEGPLAAMPYRAQASGVMRTQNWKLDGSGVLDASGPDYRVSFDGSGGFGRAELRTVESAVVTFGGPASGARLRLAADQGRLDVDARFDEAGSDVQARLDNIALGLFNEDLTGEVDGRLTLQGRGASLAGQLDAQLDGARARGTAAELGLNGTLTGRLQGDALRLTASASNPQGLKSNADITFPAEASAAPFRLAIDKRKPMRGTFAAEGEVKALWDLLVGGERTLSGRVTTSGTIGGTLADPRLVGTAAMDGGRFEDAASGLALNDVVVRAALADNLINVSQFTASDGHGGGVTGDGRFSLLRGGASSFEMDLKGFRLIDNELGSAQASGKATMRRSADGKVQLEGDLTIDRADIAANPPTPSGVVPMEVVERNKPQEQLALLPTEKPAGPTISLNVALKAPRRIFMRGRGLDVELSLDAHVAGTTDRPTLSGTARVVRGDYDFGGKRFEFDDRGIVYLATQPERIRLDLTATRDDPSLTAVVRIRGTAAKPEIQLTSSPVLPNDEVLSQVLFGRSASQLSPLEAAQLAAALSALAGGGGFDVIGGLRTFAGLDRLAFAGGNEESGVSVAGGKYLTEDVYLEIAGGGREGSRATVEWRVRRTLSVVSRITSQGDARLSVRWRRDY